MIDEGKQQCHRPQTHREVFINCSSRFQQVKKGGSDIDGLRECWDRGLCGCVLPVTFEQALRIMHSMQTSLTDATWFAHFDQDLLDRLRLHSSGGRSERKKIRESTF